MRTDDYWVALLVRQANEVDEASESLIDARDEGGDVETAAAIFRQALQVYKSTLEVCPLDAIASVASRSVRATHG